MCADKNDCHSDKIKFSIIIPVYNCEKYLRRCLDSILNQGTDGYEIILINDGSSDCSLYICREYAERYSNVFVENRENGGVSSARNTGIKRAAGKYITFIDADDYTASDYVKTISVSADRMQAENYDLAVLSNYVQENISNKSVIRISRVNGEISDMNVFFKGLCQQRFNAPWNKIFCADIIRRNNIRFPDGMKSSEDGMFLMQYIKYVKRVLPVNKAVYYYAKNADSAVSNTKPEYINDNMRMHKEIVSFAKENCPQYIACANNETTERIYFIVFKLLCKRIDKNDISDILESMKSDLKSLNYGLDKKNKCKFLLLKYRLYGIIKKSIGR